MPGASSADPRTGHLEAARGRSDASQEPAAVIAADEPREPDGGAGGSRTVSAGAQAQDSRAGNVPTDRGAERAGFAEGGEHGDGGRGEECWRREWCADGGGAGGAGVWGDEPYDDVGSDSGSDRWVEVGEEGVMGV